MVTSWQVGETLPERMQATGRERTEDTPARVTHSCNVPVTFSPNRAMGTALILTLAEVELPGLPSVPTGYFLHLLLLPNISCLHTSPPRLLTADVKCPHTGKLNYFS